VSLGKISAVNPFDQIKSKLPRATDIVISFELKKNDVCHHFDIKEDVDGGFFAIWKNMDTAFETPIGNRVEKTFEDLVHEIRVYATGF
jgi:hypothetical protein